LCRSNPAGDIERKRCSYAYRIGSDVVPRNLTRSAPGLDFKGENMKRSIVSIGSVLFLLGAFAPATRSQNVTYYGCVGI
jgi:hypothetical protein